MSIPYAKIEDLISLCKQVNEKEYKEEWDKRIHVLDIAATLQKLIDDDMAEMERISEQFATQEMEMPTVEGMKEINLISEEYERTRLEISARNS